MRKDHLRSVNPGRFSVWGPADGVSRLYAKSYGLLGAKIATEPRSYHYELGGPSLGATIPARLKRSELYQSCNSVYARLITEEFPVQFYIG
ncbi:hypothetical protein SCLCIDRAFT_1218461 [Scleroderma citrinum Foug A]|uniref:Uncharacterized protein n=1 Tax=Scleroderma citrinum Foug A TaxID=1036808 RepID=A0A0C3A1U8_9AGAM|nr:hypothetical protein SCLCIDRAFT_1218461 [Scleroderma citrinum Foug A]